MKKYNWLKWVLLSLLLVVLLSWIVPAAQMQGNLIELGRTQVGIFDLGTYPLVCLMYFGYIAIFMLCVGGFYGILNQTGVYRKLLDKVTEMFKGRETIFLIASILIIAILTSITGLTVGLFLIFPLIISLVLLMGYNKIVAASVTVGSMVIGIFGNLFGSTTSNLNEILSLKYTDEIVTKIILLVIGLVLLIYHTISYAKKVKSDSITESREYIPEKVETKKKIWPMVVMFDLLVIFVILALTDWQGAFNINLFSDITKKAAEFEVGGFPIFAKILGSNLLGTTPLAFGEWTLREVIPVIVIVSLILVAIYRIKMKDALDGFATGMKKALYPALLVSIIYMILIVTTYHPFQLIIYKSIFSLANGFNVLTTSLVAILSSFFNPELLYGSESSLRYFVSIITNKELYPVVEIIYQTLYASTMLIAPTSVVLVGTLSYLKVPYKNWLGYVWKLLLELVVIAFIVFTILTVVN